MRLMFAALVAVLLCAPALPATAHESGLYDMACCSGQDCFPVPNGGPLGQVTVTRTGYNVVIVQLPPQLGGAAMNPPLRYHVVESNTRSSKDEDAHACLYPTPGGEQPWGLRCLYVPAMGS